MIQIDIREFVTLVFELTINLGVFFPVTYMNGELF